MGGVSCVLELVRVVEIKRAFWRGIAVGVELRDVIYVLHIVGPMEVEVHRLGLHSQAFERHGDLQFCAFCRIANIYAGVPFAVRSTSLDS